MSVSFIIPTFNAAELLSSTLRSLSNCYQSDDEIILVDNVSSDSTVSIFTDYVSTFTCSFSVICEPDNGIYNAINKGIHASSCSYCAILHAGDCLVANSYRSVYTLLTSKHAPVILFSRNSTSLYNPTRKNTATLHSLYYTMSFSHSNFLIPREYYQLYGYYIEDYRISSDYIFLRSLLLRSWPISPLDACLITSLPGGVSQKPRYIFSILKEVLFDPSNSYLSFQHLILQYFFLFRQSLAILRYVLK